MQYPECVLVGLIDAKTLRCEKLITRKGNSVTLSTCKRLCAVSGNGLSESRLAAMGS